jgi:hypothetical protein
MSEPLAAIAALRRAIPAELRAEVVALVGAIAGEASARAGWLARPLPGSATQIACVLADVWLAQTPLHTPEARVCAEGIRVCLEVDDPIVAWSAAQLACRYPPCHGDPTRPYSHLAMLLHDLPAAAEYAIVGALATMLSPEDAGNPTALYDWLVTRERAPSVDSPAIVAGVRSDNPAIRSMCERLLAGPPPAQPWSLSALRQAFTPICTGAHYGSFELVAIDHAHEDWIAVLNEPELDDLRAAEQLGLELAVAGRLSPDALARRVFEDGAFEPVARSTMRDQLVRLIVSDRMHPARSEAAGLVHAMLEILGPALECRRRTSGNVRGSTIWDTWTVQDTFGVFSLVIVYLNYQ